MASHNEFHFVRKRCWLSGFSNLYAKENRRWWRTRQWLVQTLIWLVVVNGMVAMVVWSGSKDQAQQAEAREKIQSEYGKPLPAPLSVDQAGMAGFLAMIGLAVPVGVIILGQDAILTEKQSGTASWVLSKPASRTAFILSKLAANMLGILITMILIQGGAAYLQIWLSTGKALPIVPFTGALGLAFLNLSFYLALTIMLGTLFNGRGAVIGIPLALVFGYQLLGKLGEWAMAIMPWSLTVSQGSTRPSLALALIQGVSLPTLTPLFATIFWCLSFTTIALWRFNREEL